MSFVLNVKLDECMEYVKFISPAPETDVVSGRWPKEYWLNELIKITHPIAKSEEKIFNLYKTHLKENKSMWYLEKQ